MFCDHIQINNDGIGINWHVVPSRHVEEISRKAHYTCSWMWLLTQICLLYILIRLAHNSSLRPLISTNLCKTIELKSLSLPFEWSLSEANSHIHLLVHQLMTYCTTWRKIDSPFCSHMYQWYKFQHYCKTKIYRLYFRFQDSITAWKLKENMLKREQNEWMNEWERGSVNSMKCFNKNK